MSLKLTVPQTQLLNENTLEIVVIPETKLVLEHSLISISKWESIWHEAFLKDRETLGGEMTEEMMLSYMQCMTINGEFDPKVYMCITQPQMVQIKSYLEDPMTGTTFKNDGPGHSGVGSITTSEEIYYAMFKWQVPKECEKWHINRLMTLLRVFSEKENPRKMSQQEAAQDMYNRNMYRRAKAAGKAAKRR